MPYFKGLKAISPCKYIIYLVYSINIISYFSSLEEKTMKKYLTIGSVAAILIGALAGCNSAGSNPRPRGVIWSKAIDNAMYDSVGAVLPLHSKIEASKFTTEGGHGSFTAFYNYDEAAFEAGMARSREYGNILKDDGYTHITERDNVTEFLVFQVYKKDFKKGHPVYVEVAGGRFDGTNLSETYEKTCGFGIKALDRDNAVTIQQEWKAGHKYRDMRSAAYVNEPNTTGVQKNLILPVEFTDIKFDHLPGGENQLLDYIDIAFNGSPEDENVQWHSLSSYYKETSYGKLNITGDYLNFNEDAAEGSKFGDDDFNPIFSLPWSTTELIQMEADSSSTGASATFKILDHLVQSLLIGRFKWDLAKYNEFLAPFDTNNDMYIDNVWFIYPYCSNPASNDQTLTNSQKAPAKSLFWAFTHHQFYNSSAGSRILPYTYAWMSWDMLFSNGEWEAQADGSEKYVDYIDYSKFNYYKDPVLDYSKLDATGRIAAGTARTDAHTLVHEHGHVLGMPDYYSYDQGVVVGPLGGVDMMDHNVGDHNGYSKMGYGWTMPKVVNYPTTVALKPFEKDGDIIVLPLRNSWKNTMLDEYLVLEYVKPTGLNEFDSKHNYTNSSGYPKTWGEAGIKVTHVDSRLAIFTSDDAGNWNFSRYTDTLSAQGEGSKIDVAADNTASRSVTFYNANKNGAEDKTRLIEILNPEGLLDKGGYADSSNLFKAGDSLLNENLSVYYLNSGANFGWNFKIDSIESDYAVITFSRTRG